MSEFLIRPASIEDCSAMGHIIIAATQDAFRGRVPDPCLQWLTAEESAANWKKLFKSKHQLVEGEFLFVAEKQGQGVIGLALLSNWSDENNLDSHVLKTFPWELRTLHVAPAWQRQGIGHRLVACVADQVWQEGGRQLLVRVLVENPNRGFYEHLNARRLGSQPYEWEGYQTEELLYAWDNITVLRNAT